MTEVRHLHVVDENGQATPQCSRCLALLESLDKQQGTIQRQREELAELRDEKRKELATTDLAGDILDVLRLHRRLLSPSATIHRGGPAWKAVKTCLEQTDAETGRLAFTKRHLQAAVVGLKLVDAEDDWYRRHGKIGAAFLFANPDRVSEFIGVCRGFHREHGSSALAIADQLGSPALAWLADRCSCGQLRASHLMGWTDCEFDELYAKVERWKAGRERMAS